MTTWAGLLSSTLPKRGSTTALASSSNTERTPISRMHRLHAIIILNACNIYDVWQCFRIVLYKLRIQIQTPVIFNSHKGIAGAITDLLFFCHSMNLNCIGALSFELLKEEYWRNVFFNQFYWSEAGNDNRKNVVNWMLNKIEEE